MRVKLRLATVTLTAGIIILIGSPGLFSMLFLVSSGGAETGRAAVAGLLAQSTLVAEYVRREGFI